MPIAAWPRLVKRLVRVNPLALVNASSIISSTSRWSRTKPGGGRVAAELIATPIHTCSLDDDTQYLDCQRPGCLWSRVIEEGERIAVLGLGHKQWHARQEDICRKAKQHDYQGQRCQICLEPDPNYTAEPANLPAMATT